MLLYSETYGFNRQPQQPVLVFLHGLLGSGKDWRKVIDILVPYYQCITIDLPGHGFSSMLRLSHEAETEQGFKQVEQALRKTLTHRGIKNYILIGYSMGARLAMYHATCSKHAAVSAQSPALRLEKLFLEGGHFGLPENERSARDNNDQHWAMRFREQPLCDVLKDWYQQAVFSSLDDEQKQSLIAKRSDNTGQGIANMLLATSLAKQPLLLETLQKLSIPVRYVCGEWDNKFSQLGMASGLDIDVIASAGHNIHLENPMAFAAALQDFIR